MAPPSANEMPKNRNGLHKRLGVENPQLAPMTPTLPMSTAHTLAMVIYLEIIMSKEKTALFIDGSNFYAAARALNMDIDYAKLHSFFQR